LLSELKNKKYWISKDRVAKFALPRGLRYGSFDSLVKLTDELAKFDGTLDSSLRKYERNLGELLEVGDTGKLNFFVIDQDSTKSASAYLSGWAWDGAKFGYDSTNQYWHMTVSEILSVMMTAQSKLDETVRTYATKQGDIKIKKEASDNRFWDLKGVCPSYVNVELVDVLVPSCVRQKSESECHGEDDFIETEHLTTLVAVIGKGKEEKDFDSWYVGSLDVLDEEVGELIPSNKIVPKSFRKLNVGPDKDGNTLFRVVLFRNAVDDFKKVCRDRRYCVREFLYKKSEYEKLLAKRETIGNSEKNAREILVNVIRAAWSDTFINHVHLKVLRTFVESLMRFGADDKTRCYCFQPHPQKTLLVRKDLEGYFGKCANADVEGEEFYNYISLSLTVGPADETPDEEARKLVKASSVVVD